MKYRNQSLIKYETFNNMPDCIIIYDKAHDLCSNLLKSIDRKLTENDISFVAYNDIIDGSVMHDIRSCNVLILLFTQDANESEFVLSCVDLAFNGKKPIVPLMLEDTLLSDEFKYYLGRKQWLVINDDISDKIDELIATLKILLGREKDIQHDVSSLQIFASEDVSVYMDDRYIGRGRKARLFETNVLKGYHNIVIKSVRNPLISVEYEHVPFVDELVYYNVDFTPLWRDLYDNIDSRYMELASGNKIYPMSCGYAAYQDYQTGRYGYVNEYYQDITHGAIYTYVMGFESNGYAQVEISGRRGLINSEGKLVVPCEYRQVVVIKPGFFWLVVNDTEHAVMREDGKILTEFIYGDIYSYNDSLMLLKGNNDDYCVIDNDGNQVFPLSNKQLTLTNSVRYILMSSEGQNQQIYDLYENVVIHELSPDCFVQSFGENVYVYYNGSKWGVSDIKGNIIAPPMYDYIYPFEEGLAACAINDTVGFINESGKEVIPFVFKYLGGETVNSKLHHHRKERQYVFTDGLAKVFDLEGRWHIINKKGEIFK